jgi:hypothetical protein
MQPSSCLNSRNRHDAARLADAAQLPGQGLRRGAVPGRPYTHPIELVPIFCVWGDEGGETLGGHIADQPVGIFAAAKGAELHREAAARG